MPKEICQKCHLPVKQLYTVAVAPKASAKMCSECSNRWFDARDRVVIEEFRKYLQEKA